MFEYVNSKLLMENDSFLKIGILYFSDFKKLKSLYNLYF